MSTVRTRIAPSPTGFPHLGLIYQALFDFVFAHSYKGTFVLRIEDTDRTRFVQDAENVIYDSLKWVKLLPDEGPQEGGNYGPYRQSERLHLYKEYVDQLLASKHAYRCFCTKERLDEMRKRQEMQHKAPMYDKTCRHLSESDIQEKLVNNVAFVVRMKIPENETLIVSDAIVGDVSFDTNQLDDQVIFKSDGFPTYHFALVVDDYLMKITHVFRGTEWLPSYPKHVLLWRYLGWEKDMPVFIHLPILLNNTGGGKLSKRHAHTSVAYYKEEGFLPEAVLNYLANVVWNHPEGKEVFPFMELGKAFQLHPPHFDLKPNGVKFDLDKLLWMNGEYIRLMSIDNLYKALRHYYQECRNDKVMGSFLDNSKDIMKVITLSQTRMTTLKEFRPLVQHFLEEPVISGKSQAYEIIIQNLLERFATIPDWKSDEIFLVMKTILTDHKIKMSVLYKILTGQERGLPLAESLEILGKEKTINRLKQQI